MKQYLEDLKDHFSIGAQNFLYCIAVILLTVVYGVTYSAGFVLWYTAKALQIAAAAMLWRWDIVRIKIKQFTLNIGL